MKKIFFLALAVTAFGFASCNKCKTCTSGNTSTEICKSDYANETQYNAAINAMELMGATCK